MTTESVRWTLLVPMKTLPAAKSRLAETVPAQWHAELVAAIREDTLRAACAASQVGRVVVISDGAAEFGGDITLRQSSDGLNGALRDGAAHAVQHWPADGIAALVGDLPALRPEELDATLALAAAHPRGFVADAEGTGTTLLTVRPGSELRPRFGPGSAQRHGVDCVLLASGPGLRHDVDTAEDLTAAARVGVGPATRAVIERLNEPAPNSSARGMMGP